MSQSKPESYRRPVTAYPTPMDTPSFPLTPDTYPLFPSTAGEYGCQVEYDYHTLPYDLYQQFSAQDDFSGTVIVEDGAYMLPTPTQSQSASPTSDVPLDDLEESNVVSVSTVFHPGALTTPCDLILSSSDSVLFYVHTHTIQHASPRAFRTLLAAPLKSAHGVVAVPEPADILNVILHMLYGTSCAAHSPTFATLAAAVDRMPGHGIVPRVHIRPGAPLYALLLSHAPLVPLELYALAAHHSLEDLAVSTSSHLLAFSLSSITDEMAARMGAAYLRRLMLLHLHRFDALRRILLPPPRPHPATRKCTFEDQKKLTRAWALVAAYLAWDAHSDLSTHSMQSALIPLTEHLECEMCSQGLNSRIKEVVVLWSAVERTI